MTDLEFEAIWDMALNTEDSKCFLEICKELYVREYSKETEAILLNIFFVAHLSVKDIVGTTKLSQKEFATRFCIPQRTVEAWCTGSRKCNDYIRLMMCRQLGIL